MSKTPHFIDGRWVAGSGPIFTSQNPATLETLWEGAAAGEQEIGAALNAARVAFKDWANLTLEARLSHLETFRASLEADKLAMTEALSQETGKPRWDAAVEINAMIGKLAVSLDAYRERTGSREGKGAGFKTTLVHRPYGVVAVFGPYNFPAHLPNGHIVPALLAGNTVIFKPSEQTPLVAELTLKHWEKSGIPAGVINLVQGERETGKLLAAHPALDGLFFTGSSDTGMLLHKQFADRPGKILALELGGNNPMIVQNVGDLDAAAFMIVQSAFMSSGQRCSCTRRLILPKDGKREALLEKLVAAAGKLTVGAYDQTPEPYMGPLISEREVLRLLEAQESLIALGAKSLLKMTRLDAEKWFLTPGILDVTDVKDLPDREYFGPLLQVIRTGNFDEAIAAANNTQYGLTAGILSDRREDFDRFLREARAGVVNWNRPTTGASASAPFGGLGKSGDLRPSGYYAADYCAYPVASTYAEELALPDALPPGFPKP